MSAEPPWSEASEWNSDSADEEERGRSVKFVLRARCDKEVFWLELNSQQLPLYDAALLDPAPDGSREGWYCLAGSAPEEALGQLAAWLRAHPDVQEVHIYPPRPR